MQRTSTTPTELDPTYDVAKVIRLWAERVRSDPDRYDRLASTGWRGADAEHEARFLASLFVHATEVGLL
jgi:hypothetical protein